MTRTYTLKRQHRPRVARRVVLAVAAAAVAGAMSIVGGVHTTPTPYSHHVAAIAAVHESRHTTCSLMEKAGVPVSVIAAWAGHYSGAFTMATYVHANPDDLAAGRDALAAIYRTETAP